MEDSASAEDTAGCAPSVSGDDWEAAGCSTTGSAADAITEVLSEPDPQAHRLRVVQYVINKMRSSADDLGIRIKIVTSCCYSSIPVT